MTAKATKNGKAKKPSRPRQMYLKGMEPKAHPEIDQAARDYVETRDARMALTKEETDRADTLWMLMKRHNLKTYEFDGMVVSLSQTEKVKVKRKSEEKTED